MTRQAYGLDRIVEREFPADESLDARALERNAPTIKNIRLWDYRPLLRTFAQLQEIRTYYKFQDVDNDRYVVDGEYRQLMLSPRELSYPHLQSRIWINEHLTFTHGYGVVVGPVNRITAEGLPEFLVKDIPPASTGGLPEGDAAGDLLRRDLQRVRARADALAGARLSGGRPERVHDVPRARRRRAELVVPEARVRRALRRAQDPALERPHRREPHHDVPRGGPARAPDRAVLPLRPRSRTSS